MRSEGEDFIMEGLSLDDPNRIKSVSELTDRVKEYGFLPFFKNSITGFSVEEMTASAHWWSGNPEQDPWIWRELIAKEGIVSYSKIFRRKAGFVSREWYPTFANYRRDGYDFDARYEDGLASPMDKAIYEALLEKQEMSSFELKALLCGKSRKGTGFDTSLVRLQMQAYITVSGFCRKKTKQGEEYGWSAAVYTTAENLFGEEQVQKEYQKEPKNSRDKLIQRVHELYPDARMLDIEKLIS